MLESQFDLLVGIDDLSSCPSSQIDALEQAEASSVS